MAGTLGAPGGAEVVADGRYGLVDDVVLRCHGLAARRRLGQSHLDPAFDSPLGFVVLDLAVHFGTHRLQAFLDAAEHLLTPVG